MTFLFIDRITAYHSSIVIQSDGSKKTVRCSSPFVDNLRCQMSYSGDDSASPKGKSTFPRQRGLKIFVSGIRHGFKSGDWIVVRRNGAILHEGSIGEPKVYDRLIVHTELSFDAWRGDGNG